MKDYCRKHNETFTLRGIEELVPKGVEIVSPEMWSKFCRHVKEVEDEYWLTDGLVEDVVEEFILKVGVDSDDESDDEDDSDSDGQVTDDEQDTNPQREEERLMHVLDEQPT